jgi:hypothetical protein
MEAPDIPRAAYAPTTYSATTPRQHMDGAAREMVEHGPLCEAVFTVPPLTRTQLISEQKSLERELQIIDYRLAAITIELAALPSAELT